MKLTRAEEAMIERRRKAAERRRSVKPKVNKQARVRDTAYLAWVRRLPCLNCGAGRAVEAAHIRCGYPEAGWSPTGMQRKPDDSRVAPLCAHCHREGPDAQHRSNERTWWADRGIYPPELCAQLYAAFEAERDGDPIIREFAAIAAGQRADNTIIGRGL